MTSTTALNTKTSVFRWGSRAPLLALSLVVVLIDRFSKFLVDRNLRPGSAITVIPNIFRISHVLNTGAAFSMFSESTSPEVVRDGLILFSIFAAIVVFVMLWRAGDAINFTSVALALILGGALGNLYDRVRYHFVIDFLEVKIIHYHWPDFNIADSCIVIGACLLLIEIFRPQPSAS
ncbi:signal peptidase II [Granulicella sp. dw_53]|uniref:signal peptidase II n=1 Tax=Granulicella sp. dw_53 TaxID=2719792 RepID=UPI001BD64060|nr:signal peptidase II [Granulicella sp. dw_53]